MRRLIWHKDWHKPAKIRRPSTKNCPGALSTCIFFSCQNPPKCPVSRLISSHKEHLKGSKTNYKLPLERRTSGAESDRRCYLNVPEQQRGFQLGLDRWSYQQWNHVQWKDRHPWSDRGSLQCLLSSSPSSYELITFPW